MSPAANELLFVSPFSPEPENKEAIELASMLPPGVWPWAEIELKFMFLGYVPEAVTPLAVNGKKTSVAS